MVRSIRAFLTGAVVATAMAATGPASAAVIGGVEIDPDNFVITRADTWERTATSLGAELTGFGRVLSLNNDTNFCTGCELTFVYDDYIVTEVGEDGASIAYNGGRVRFFVDDSPDFNGAPSLANASDGQLWLELAGLEYTDSRTGLTGTLIGRGVGFDTDQPTGFGDGRLQLIENMDALATAFFQNARQPILFTTNFQNVGRGTDEFPMTGSATMTARFDVSPIPEPGTLGLLGAALLGIGLLRRRR